MKHAIIKTGGKQYLVQEKDIVTVEKLKGTAGEAVAFDTLAIFEAKGETVNLGNPILSEGVKGEIVSTEKGEKVSVIKFKNKTRYRRNVGHRQTQTKVKITSIA